MRVFVSFLLRVLKKKYIYKKVALPPRINKPQSRLVGELEETCAVFIFFLSFFLSFFPFFLLSFFLFFFFVLGNKLV